MKLSSDFWSWLAGPDEFVFINIVGPLDIAQVGRIGRKFDIEPLDSIDFGAATPKAPSERLAMTKLTLYAIIALSLTGCFRAADLGQLRRDIERELPEVQYEREIEMSFGSYECGFCSLGHPFSCLRAGECAVC